MGLASLILGDQNPFAQFVAQNKNTIRGIGAGLGSGQNFSTGLANAAQGAAAGGPADDAYATAQKAEAERQAAIQQQAALRQKYAQFFQQQNQPIYSQFVADGVMDPGTAYSDWQKSLKEPGNTLVQQIQDRFAQGQAQGLQGDDLRRFSLTGNIPDPVKPTAAPTGYQWAPDGKALAPIPHGPADPATAGKTTEATRRNQQLAKVLEPEVQSLLGADGKSGTFDALTNGWSQTVDAMGPLGLAIGGGPAAEYQQAKNSLKTIIASYLYSVSGATANPGEVETQASVLTPKPNEPPASVADKRRRIAIMVQAVRDAATGMPIDLSGPATTGSTGDPELDRALQQYGN